MSSTPPGDSSPKLTFSSVFERAVRFSTELNAGADSDASNAFLQNPGLPADSRLNDSLFAKIPPLEQIQYPLADLQRYTSAYYRGSFSLTEPPLPSHSDAAPSFSPAAPASLSKPRPFAAPDSATPPAETSPPPSIVPTPAAAPDSVPRYTPSFRLPSKAGGRSSAPEPPPQWTAPPPPPPESANLESLSALAALCRDKSPPPPAPAKPPEPAKPAAPAVAASLATGTPAPGRVAFSVPTRAASVATGAPAAGRGGSTFPTRAVAVEAPAAAPPQKSQPGFPAAKAPEGGQGGGAPALQKPPAFPTPAQGRPFSFGGATATTGRAAFTTAGATGGFKFGTGAAAAESKSPATQEQKPATGGVPPAPWPPEESWKA